MIDLRSLHFRFLAEFVFTHTGHLQSFRQFYSYRSVHHTVFFVSFFIKFFPKGKPFHLCNPRGMRKVCRHKK